MKPAALLVALVLLASACGSGDDPAVEPGSGTTATIVVGDPGTTTPADDGGPDDSSATTRGNGPPATTAGDPPPASPTTNGAPGSAAAFFLRPAPARTIVVEISAEEGAEPTTSTVRHVATVLADVTGKSTLTSEGGVPPSRDTWTAADVRAAADDVARTSQGDDAVVRLLFLHGRWAEGEGVLGVAVRGDVGAIFVDAVRAAATPLVGGDAIETAVTVHEVGHLLGLVDLHLQTGRGDPEHPGHSTSSGSVMYWAVESSLVTDLLTGGPPRNFDEADRADLQAIRDGA